MEPHLIPSFGYYNYSFISADPLHAEIREEMRSYFDTGAIDDTMFPVYTEKALKKLGRSSYKIDEAILELENTCAPLPADFCFFRQVLLCADVCYSVPFPSAVYTSQTVVISVQPAPAGSASCSENCCKACTVYEKTTGETLVSFKISRQLFPGNRHAGSFCGNGHPDISLAGPDTFDIRDGKLSTRFATGTIYLLYYKKETDENQYQLIPDNYAIAEYIKAFIKYKLYEHLYNTTTDETFNQIERKYNNYQQQYLDAYIIADAEIKKQTVYQKIDAIKRQRRYMDRYYIP